MIAILNLLVIAAMVALYFLFDAIGIEFAAGFAVAAIMFQCAYRLQHGRWFE